MCLGIGEGKVWDAVGKIGIAALLENHVIQTDLPLLTRIISMILST